MRLLLVNGNTTQAVTEACLAEARRCALPGTLIAGATARFGASIVTARPENVIAAHAVLELLAQHRHDCDAAILAISFDSGLFAARDLMPFPVIGITEAGLHTACMLGTRVGVISFGTASLPLYRELVETLGLGARIARLHAIDVASTAAYLDTAVQETAILEAAERLQREDGAEIVLICGAAFAGIAARLQPRSTVRLLDGVGCAVRQAQALLQADPGPPHARPALAASASHSGLPAALAAALRGDRE